MHVSVQSQGIKGGEGGGKDEARGPQSAQSVPYWQSGYSAPGPPSSQKPSEAYVGIPMQLLRQTYPGRRGDGGGASGNGSGEGGGGGDFGGEGAGDGINGGDARQGRGPQSRQSPP